MPHGLQLLTFSKVGISGTNWEAVSPVSGDSATFYNIPLNSNAYVSEIWATDNLNAAEVAVTATRWHDQIYGIRGAVTSGAATAPINRAQRISGIGIDQPIYSGDVMTVQCKGTASDDVIITVLVYYPEIGGPSARLATFDYVKQNTKNVVGINVNLTPGDGVAGTAVALNAADNRLHANTDYALLGFTSTLAFGSIRVYGVDTGNLKVGGPMLGDPDHDGYMFADYAQAYNTALIPVINSNNAGSTFIEGIGTDVGATVVDAMLVELKQPFQG